MTKEITKAFILQQIQDKFGLRDLVPEKFVFSETVIPTYNVESHLGKWRAKAATMSINSTGPFTMLAVPMTEQWTLWRYDVVFMASGAYTIAGMYTRRLADASGDTCYLDLGAAKSASYHIDLPVPVVLHSGDKILANVDGYTSTADLRIYIDYMVEEIR